MQQLLLGPHGACVHVSGASVDASLQEHKPHRSQDVSIAVLGGVDSMGHVRCAGAKKPVQPELLVIQAR